MIKYLSPILFVLLLQGSIEASQLDESSLIARGGGIGGGGGRAGGAVGRAGGVGGVGARPGSIQRTPALSRPALNNAANNRTVGAAAAGYRAGQNNASSYGGGYSYPTDPYYYYPTSTTGTTPTTYPGSTTVTYPVYPKP